MTGLGDLAGGAFDSQAFGVSPNGALVVGRGESASGDEAFLWQSGPGMVGLGDLAGGIFASAAFDVTDAGVVVGSSEQRRRPRGVRLGRRTMYSLLDVLVANGLAAQVAAGRSVEARAISDDGLTFAGCGSNPDGDTEAWVATIGFVPEPSTGLLLGLGRAVLGAARARIAPRRERAQRGRAERAEQKERPRAAERRDRAGATNGPDTSNVLPGLRCELK